MTPMFSFQSFKNTESTEQVAEEVKKIKIDEEKPKETQSEEAVNEVGWGAGDLVGCWGLEALLSGGKVLNFAAVLLFSLGAPF